MICWHVLGIKRTRDRSEIRRAYAAKLKVTNPEDDADGFKALRAAYEQALAYAGGPPAATVAFAAPLPRPPAEQPKPEIRSETTTSPSSPPAPTAATTTPQIESEPQPQPDSNPRQRELAAHDALRQALFNRLHPDVAPDDRMLQAAFKALVESEAMTMLDVRDQTEGWIAWLLNQAAPRSDSLLVPAIHHFGWSTRNLDRHTPPAVRQVLARANALAAMQPFLRKGGAYHRAWKVLVGPPRPISLLHRLFGPTPFTVRALLIKLRQQHGGLQAGLNPQTIALWEDWLQRPHMKGWMLWLMVAALPCAAMIAFILRSPTDDPTGDQTRIFYPAAALVAALVSVSWHFAHEWPAYLWRTRAAHLHRNLWATLGWAPAALVMLGVSTTPISWISGPAAGLAITVTFWASVTGIGDRRPSNMPWFLRGVQGYIIPILWLGAIGVLLVVHGGFATAIAGLATIATFIAGKESLRQLWTSLDRARQSAAILVLAFLCFATGALCIVGLPTSIEPGWSASSLAPVAVALVTAMVVLSRLPVRDDSGFIATLIVLRGIGFFMFLIASIGLPFLGGLAVLVWALYCLIRAWNEQRGRNPPYVPKG